VTKSDPYDPEQYSGALPDLRPEEKPQRERAQHASGFVLIPAQIVARLNGVSGPALQVLCCLLQLEFKALVKGEPIALTNKAAAMWGIHRKQKHRGLAELARRGIITHTQHGKSSPRAKFWLQFLN